MTPPVLTVRERCLVGLAAGVAAGCAPCVGYHVDKATRSGATDRELQAAVTVAAAVRREATEDIVRHARELSGKNVGEPPAAFVADSDIAALIAAAAAYAVNSHAVLTRMVEGALARGLVREQLVEAADIARAVRAMAVTIVDRHVEETLGGRGPAADQSPGACVCG